MRGPLATAFPVAGRARLHRPRTGRTTEGMDIAQISPYYYRPAPEIISNGSAVMTWQGCCTMSPERSALLNQKLPDDLAALG